MMYFNTWRWHAKNSTLTAAFEPANLLLLTWIMPFFYLVAGFAAWHALARRSAGAFLRERFLRLGVPVLLGIFLLSPFQVYSERVTFHEFTGGFRSFLPHYFEGWYSITPGGNFAWMGLHLWMIFFLLLYAIVTLPLFIRAGRDRRPGLFTRLFAATGPAGILLLVPLLVLTFEGVLLALKLNISQSGWPMGVYLADYIIGFYLLTRESFRSAVRRLGPAAIVGILVTAWPVMFVQGPSRFGLGLILWEANKAYNSWFWIVALFYIGDRYLNRNSAALQYCSEAVMPFYILHQPVIVTLGFLVRAVALPVALKFPLLLVVSFAIIMTIYHFVVRRVNLLRFLFGMKPKPPAVAVQVQAA